MRRAERIDEFLKEFGKLWKIVPDWRFGQLIVNFQRWYGRDIFFMEEDKALRLLKEFFGVEDEDGGKDSN